MRVFCERGRRTVATDTAENDESMTYNDIHDWYMSHRPPDDGDVKGRVDNLEFCILAELVEAEEKRLKETDKEGSAGGTR